MKRPLVALAILSLLFVLATGLGGASSAFRSASTSATTASFSTKTSPSVFSSSLVPLSFEENEGQASPGVKYLAHGAGLALLLTDSKSVLSIPGACQKTASSRMFTVIRQRQLAASKFDRALVRHFQRCQSSTLQMAFDGANPAHLTGVGELAAKTNYFVGRDQSKWRTGIPNYARVQYAGLYPGVNLVFYGNRGHLEFDFVVAPGADPHQIVLKFDPAKDLHLAANGDLQIGPRSSAVLLRRPSIYQMEGQSTRPIRGGFALLAGGRVSLQVGAYDHAQPLIVDPVLTYSTFLNGAGGDSEADAIAVDSKGDAYVAGTTSSPSFPTVNPYQSSAGAPANGIVFLSKFNAAGTQLLYSTYLGGTGGDIATGVAIDSAGNAYVTGYTFSTDFPVLSAFQTVNNNPNAGNAFVAKINTTASGAASLAYSSYLGGGGASNPNPWYGDSGLGIAADSAGRAYITGDTVSDTSVAAFPTTSNAYQSSLSSPNGNAFLTVVDTTRSGSSSLVYSTYLGGDGAGYFGDIGLGVAADGSGNAYIVGQTTSDGAGPFPTSSGAYQATLNGASGNAFLTEIATTKSGASSLVYSTYFGGTANGSFGDSADAVALDPSGHVYIAGYAESSNFPTTSGAFQTVNNANGKPFVAKFNLAQSGTSSLVSSTLLGGTNTSGGQGVAGIAVDGSGDAFVVGQTSASDFPVTSNAYQSSYKSTAGSNAFLAELDPSASTLLYSTYLGGSNYDFAIGVALDPLGDVYIVGSTQSSDFPTTPGSLQPTMIGSASGFVTQMSSPNGASIALSANPTAATVSSRQSASYALSVMSQGTFSSPITFSCSGVPQYANCQFSPASVSSGSGTGTTTLTITTGGNGSALWVPPNRPESRRPTSAALLAGVLLALIALVSALAFSNAGKSRRRLLVPLAAAFALVTVIGCGSVRSQQSHSTPPGTSQVTVQASAQTPTGTATSSITVALTVQ